MNLYLDSEFTGLHQKTTLISLAIISDDNDVFYAEFNDYDQYQIDDWLQENVINNLFYNNYHNYYKFTDDNIKDVYIKGDKYTIKKSLKKWLNWFDEIEIWSDCLSYDWVLFNDLFDHAFNIPNNIYYIPFDICTAFKMRGIDPDINREEYAEIDNNIKKHSALHDAEVIKKCYEKLFQTQKTNIIDQSLSFNANKERKGIYFTINGESCKKIGDIPVGDSFNIALNVPKELETKPNNNDYAISNSLLNNTIIFYDDIGNFFSLYVDENYDDNNESKHSPKFNEIITEIKNHYDGTIKNNFIGIYDYYNNPIKENDKMVYYNENGEKEWEFYVGGIDIYNGLYVWTDSNNLILRQYYSVFHTLYDYLLEEDELLEKAYDALESHPNNSNIFRVQMGPEIEQCQIVMTTLF